MTDSISVRPVTDKREFKAFFNFVWTLYRDDPNWTPPLLSMQRDKLDKDKNPSWAYLEGDYFVAWRGEQPVGTITAFVNHRHNEFHGENIAWFGFFEVGDDQAVASALLSTACDWARARGYSALRGPQSFTTHEECGLLVEGFSRPVMLMPYNKPYYAGLLENAGLHKVMDIYSYHLDMETGRLNQEKIDRVKKITARLTRQKNITIRASTRQTAKADFEIFKDIYNSAWEKNWGFTPMTERELDALVESLSQFYDPALACFAEVDGEPVGFLLGVPDFHQVLKLAYPAPGTPELWTMLKALWHWKIRPKIDWVRIPLMGVKESYRNMGIDVLMYAYIYDVLISSKNAYGHMDCGWILETNKPLIGIVEQIGMTHYKTHRFYERALADG